MALLNHIIARLRGQEGIAEEMKKDAETRLATWKRFTEELKEIETLSKTFNFAKAEEALQYPDALDKTLSQIERLISRDLIHIDDEDRTDEEIFSDLKRLARDRKKINDIRREIKETEDKVRHVIKLAHDIHDTLKCALHAIRKIRDKLKRYEIDGLKERLLDLFPVLYFKLCDDQRTFDGSGFADEEISKEVERLAKEVLTEQKIEKEIEAEEIKFAREVSKLMRDGSEHQYRKLAEAIWQMLLEKNNAPWEGADDFDANHPKFEAMMEDESPDGEMFKFVRKKRKKLTDVQVVAVIRAFNRSYGEGHFEEMEQEFYT
jgi:hypothetical protein